MFFEQYLNFRGILIEPIYDFYKKLVNNRKRNICINKAINNKSEIEMYVNGAVSANIDTMSCQFKKRWHKRSKKQLIQTTTLEDLFLENNIKYIDLFSLDVEGGELDVLNTINWDNIEIYLFCIELDNNDPIKDDQCRKILKEHNFVFKHKIGINEFWINPNYSRINILFDKNINKEIFSGNLDDYGNHLFLEKKARQNIENQILNYELQNK